MKPPFPWKTMLWTALASGGGLALWWIRLHSAGPHATVPSAAGSAAPAFATSAPIPLTPSTAAELRRRFWDACHIWSPKRDDFPERTASPAALTLLDGLSAADLSLLLAGNEMEKDAARRSILRQAFFEQYCCLAAEDALTLAQSWPPEIADPLITPLLTVWRLKDPNVIALANRIMTEKPGHWEHLSMAFPSPEKLPDTAAVPRSLEEALTKSRRLMAARPENSYDGDDLRPLTAWAARNQQWETVLKKLPELPAWGVEPEFCREAVHAAWITADWRAWLAWMEAHPDEGIKPGGLDFDRLNLLNNGAEWIGDEVLKKSTNEEAASILDAWIKFWKPGTPVNGPRQVFTKWAEQDPAAASAWLAAKPVAPWRDDAAAGLALTTVDEEPESALAWAAGITDPKLRDETQVSCWRSWRAFDPAAADAWADANQPGLRTAATPSTATQSEE